MSSTIFYDNAAELATWSDTITVAGVATDPTALVLTVTSPTGTQSTYNWPSPATITHGTAGVFSKDIPCTEPGEWILVAVSTGTASDVQVSRWTVFDADATLYASPESVKSRLGDSETVDDQEYRSACGAVSNWIDEWCQDFFGRVTATRTFEVVTPYEVNCGSLVSITTLKTDSGGDGTFETTWQTTDYELFPYNPSTGRETKPYNKIRAVGSLVFPMLYGGLTRRDQVQIVGVFGWPAVPAAVREAALILAVDQFKLKDSPFGVAGFGAEGFAVRVKQNPQALSLLQPYRRYPVMIG